MKRLKLFVPLGTQKFPFGRLISALNGLVDKGLYSADEIIIQSTIYDVKPKFNHVGLIPLDEFNKYMIDAEVVITHSGVNSIISCMQLNKPLVIIPRRGEYGEHVDDHQIEIAELMEKKFDVLVCHNMNELENLIQKARNHRYKPWISHKDGLISALKDIIE